jgi:hypothetical protein
MNIAMSSALTSALVLCGMGGYGVIGLRFPVHRISLQFRFIIAVKPFLGKFLEGL